jgi:predicted patatin/cPLA2 family phospholipase
VNEKSRALVLEGGGMRGTFTAGVLEAFAEE